MKAAVLKRPGEQLEIEEVAISDPGPKEVLVEVAATGLCHTDLHFIQGNLPLALPAVLGHETAGKVVAVGQDVSYLSPGDHVIGCLSAFCGCCEFCLSGRPSICGSQEQLVRSKSEEPRLSLNNNVLTQFMHLSGFAEYILVHEHTLVKIDSAMPLDKAALIGCAVITGWGAVTRTANLIPGSSVAVIGCGAVGLSTIQSAKLAGAAEVIAIDINDNRLTSAKAFGATHTINSTDIDLVQEVLNITAQKGVHYSFEAVGSPQLAEQAFLMLRKGGTLVLIGLTSSGAKVEFPASHFIAERRVIGCDMGSNQFRIDMPRLTHFYMEGRLNLDDMLTSRLPLEEINSGFSAMQEGKGLRTIIDFSY